MLRLDYPKNISRLVFRGFLTLKIRIGNYSITLKTVNENEFDDIEFYSGISWEEIEEAKGEEKELLYRKFSPWLLTWATLQINERNVLRLRETDRWYRPLVEFYSRLQRVMVDRFDLAMNHLSSWYYFEMLNVERFTMEDINRSSWESYKNVSLNDESVTSFMGSKFLGLNYHQVMFKAYMSAWEKSLEFDRYWEVAKFIGSFHDPRHVRKLNGQDKVRRQQQVEYERLMKEGHAVQLDKNKIYNEMEEEVIKSLREGKKDEFDLMMEEEDRNIKKDLLGERFIAEMFSMMYGRKMIRKDISIIGRSSSPSIDLPMGKFDRTEAKDRIKKSIDELNFLGRYAAKIEFTDGELDQVIDRAAEEALELYKSKYENRKSLEKSDGKTNINTSE